MNWKLFIRVSISCFSIFGNSYAQTRLIDLNGPYLAQKPPGKKAELFASGLINYEVHESPNISKDGKEIIIGSMSEGTKYFKMVDGTWSVYSVLPFDQPLNGAAAFDWTLS